MLSNVTGDYLLAGDSVNKKENIHGVEKNTNNQNLPVKTTEFDDSLEVSKEAKELLQKEKDIEFFKSLVLESPCSKEEINTIMELIKNGEFVDNKDLSETLKQDKDLLDYLFSDIEAVS